MLKKGSLEFFKTFWVGVSFLLPLLLVAFLAWKILTLFTNILASVIKKLGTWSGYSDFSDALGIVILILFVFLVGIALRLHVFKKYLINFENRLLFYIPGYKFYQALIKTPSSNEDKILKPCLLKEDGILRVCFLVENNSKWATLMIPEAPSFTTGEIVIVPLTKISPLTVSNFKMTGIIRNYGEGILDLIKKNQLDT
ncbi:hypothetical protein [Shivajiella indica]|uniref:DUF502 domain-containing protein n=1 Tax=Shivajiella indica TaxID=872115 RepID=A0ABW5B670_9BACT